ncbi:MAG: hypothetical protein H8E35_04925 [Ardenticatenia bacterium]|nr:hypothetical protein [Ardenticatenia bacterium]
MTWYLAEVEEAAGALAPAVVGEAAGGTGSALAAFGIQAVTGASDAVRDPLADYPGGALSGVEPCADSQYHHVGNRAH